MSVEERLASLGLNLPSVATPVANYVPAVRTGNLVYTSGQIPTESGELRIRGSVGLDITEDEAIGAAQTACLNALAAVKSVVGDLELVERVVRVTGYVASADGFTDQPTVVNGASDLLVEIFGDRGRHSRAAVGVYQLPRDAPVEIELVVQVADHGA
jgi:enamine deaminase RidA (YjgF/YER057c/UK114 family)